MLSEIAVVCCALLALQVSFGFCLPAGKTENLHIQNDNQIDLFSDMKEKEEEEGYQVILRSPSQLLKVEVVDEDGNTSMRQLEVSSDEEISQEQVTEEQMEVKRRAKRVRGDVRYQANWKCNWRRLYKLYLHKMRNSGVKRVYSKMKRNEIRDAFKVVCDNPEDALRFLLNMDPE